MEWGRVACRFSRNRFCTLPLFSLCLCGESFSEQLKLDAGRPGTTLHYAPFLTCEVVGDERIRKVRAMLVRRDLLDDFPYSDSTPKLENPWHEDRIKTLRRASALLKTEQDHFLTVETCV